MDDVFELIRSKIEKNKQRCTELSQRFAKKKIRTKEKERVLYAAMHC